MGSEAGKQVWIGATTTGGAFVTLAFAFPQTNRFCCGEMENRIWGVVLLSDVNLGHFADGNDNTPRGIIKGFSSPRFRRNLLTFKSDRIHDLHTDSLLTNRNQFALGVMRSTWKRVRSWESVDIPFVLHAIYCTGDWITIVMICIISRMSYSVSWAVLCLLSIDLVSQGLEGGLWA